MLLVSSFIEPSIVFRKYLKRSYAAHDYFTSMFLSDYGGIEVLSGSRCRDSVFL